MGRINNSILICVAVVFVLACAPIRKSESQTSFGRLNLVKSELAQPTGNMVENIKRFAGDFEYLCLQTRAQPEKINSAAENLDWIEDSESMALLPGYSFWSSSKEPFEPRNPEETPTFRLSVADFRSDEVQNTGCMLQMHTQAVDSQSIMEEVEIFRSHFSKKFEIGALTEKQSDDPRDDNRLFYEYSFQIEFAEDLTWEVRYFAVTNKIAALHNLNATWFQPVE